MENGIILIVEDSPKTQETLKKIFETQEAEIIITSSGEEGITILEKGVKPSCVILDLNLPGMNGGQVLKKMRMNDKWKQIPVVPFSSTWDEKYDEPFEKDYEVVKEYLSASRLSEKVGGGSVSSIVPKYRGWEDVDVIHPKLIISVAKTFIQQDIELSPSFQHLLYLSQKQIERTPEQF